MPGKKNDKKENTKSNIINEQLENLKEKLTDPKVKEEFKKILSKTGKGLKTFGTKILEVAEVVREDTVCGAKMGKLKLKEMDLESKKMNKLRFLGETVYNLIQKNKINYPDINEIYEDILEIEQQIQNYKNEIKKVSKKFKKINI